MNKVLRFIDLGSNEINAFDVRVCEPVPVQRSVDRFESRRE